MTENELREQLNTQNSRSKRRCTDAEVNRLCGLIEQYPDAKAIRVYSPGGFVPRWYKYLCMIQYVEATPKEDTWAFDSRWIDAHRRYGRASLVTLNRRPE